MHFFESFSWKHLVGKEILYTFALALQNPPPGALTKAIKKEFFEKIYINREVVQEASVWFYIKWMGKRNEPINSLFLFFEALPQNLSSSEKVLFKLKF